MENKNELLTQIALLTAHLGNLAWEINTGSAQNHVHDRVKALKEQYGEFIALYEHSEFPSENTLPGFSPKKRVKLAQEETCKCPVGALASWKKGRWECDDCRKPFSPPYNPA